MGWVGVGLKVYYSTEVDLTVCYVCKRFARDFQIRRQEMRACMHALAGMGWDGMGWDG